MAIFGAKRLEDKIDCRMEENEKILYSSNKVFGVEIEVE